MTIYCKCGGQFTSAAEWCRHGCGQAAEKAPRAPK